MINPVLPIAKDKYDRREEQNFRDYVRRNITDLDNRVIAASEKVRFVNIPEYANDAAAGLGGLIQGDFYRTGTGNLMVKL